MSTQYSSLWSEMIQDFSDSNSSLRGYKTYTTNSFFVFLIVYIIAFIVFLVTFCARGTGHFLNFARKILRRISKSFFGQNSYLFNLFDWRTLLAVSYLLNHPSLLFEYFSTFKLIYKSYPLPTYNSLKLFISAKIILDRCNHDLFTPTSVLEIGAGTGDFARIISYLLPSIEEYTIVDLPEMLSVSSNNLSNSNFRPKLSSLPADQFSADLMKSNQLIVNIESFAEMPSSIFTNYINLILSSMSDTSLFFSNNRESRFHDVNSPLSSDVFNTECFVDLANRPIKFSSFYSHFRDYVFSSRKRNICVFASTLNE